MLEKQQCYQATELALRLYQALVHELIQMDVIDALGSLCFIGVMEELAIGLDGECCLCLKRIKAQVMVKVTLQKKRLSSKSPLVLPYTEPYHHLGKSIRALALATWSQPLPTRPR
jgi:hypothetical protein